MAAIQDRFRWALHGRPVWVETALPADRALGNLARAARPSRAVFSSDVALARSGSAIVGEVRGPQVELAITPRWSLPWTWPALNARIVPSEAGGSVLEGHVGWPTFAVVGVLGFAALAGLIALTSLAAFAVGSGLGWLWACLGASAATALVGGAVIGTVPSGVEDEARLMTYVAAAIGASAVPEHAE